MNSVNGKVEEFFYDCSLCHGDDGYTGQFGGRSLVKTSCPTSEVFHLECITERLEHQSSNSLEQRECLCNHPALPLIRLDGMQLLEDESPYCETRMFQVCRTGDLQALTELLGEDETLANRTYHSVLTGHPEYPLSVTIKHDHTDCARTLIDRGADVNAADHQGETPLHLAAKQGNTEIVKTLLAADGIKANERDKYGATALHIAAVKGHTEIVRMLLADDGIKANVKDNDGLTALQYAASVGHIETIMVFLAAGINVNEQDNYGGTALHAAVSSGHTEAVRLLLAAGIRVNEKDKDARTALHFTAYMGFTETLKPLLAAEGINVNEKDDDGQTALHYAACMGHAENIEALLADNSIEINEEDNYGRTALYWAYKKAHTACQKLLVENGAVLDSPAFSSDEIVEAGAGS